MHKCIICNEDITSFQSYHIDASGSKHFACEVGRRPLQYPLSSFHSGEKARMTLGNEGVSPHKKEDSQPPHKSHKTEGIEPPLGKGERGNHRTKRTHTKNINGHARQYKVKKEEFDEAG